MSVESTKHYTSKHTCIITLFKRTGIRGFGLRVAELRFSRLLNDRLDVSEILLKGQSNYTKNEKTPLHNYKGKGFPWPNSSRVSGS